MCGVEYDSHRVAVPQPRDYRTQVEARANAAAAAAAINFANHQYHPAEHNPHHQQQQHTASLRDLDDPASAAARLQQGAVGDSIPNAGVSRLQRAGSEIVIAHPLQNKQSADDESVVLTSGSAGVAGSGQRNHSHHQYGTASPDMLRRARASYAAAGIDR